jgi:hypothetical protein
MLDRLSRSSPRRATELIATRMARLLDQGTADVGA